MAKVKLMHFELIALIDESKRIADYLQRLGALHIENTQHEKLVKYDNGAIINDFAKKAQTAKRAVSIIENNCDIKKSFIQSFHDFTELEYHEYKDLCESADEILALCEDICALDDERNETKAQISRKQALIDYYRPWEALDIPMSSVRTARSSIFIGFYKEPLTPLQIKERLALLIPEIESLEVQVVSASALQSCCVILCLESDRAAVDDALKKSGFIRPENPVSKLPKTVIASYEKEIEEYKARAESIRQEISDYADKYEKCRFLCDYFDIQSEKYQAVELAGTTEKTIVFEGYVPERMSEELKFEIERRFTAQMELSEPDYEQQDVPVLIQNRSFAAGVESITDMYSHPSNRDIDPNGIMSVFYYGLFGLMLSDAGYGLLMIIFALVAKYKVKVQGSTRKFADFALYSGISTVIWGVLFGGFFGDLIPTVCTAFLGMESPPEMALWFSPQQESMKMLLFSFLFGIVHLFVGLAVRFYTLCKRKDVIGAVCDVVPIYVFVTGFAIVGKDFLSPVSAEAKSLGYKLLLIGAVLIILTAGRSAKNILGKLGGGLYGLYNTTTGYMSDILSYSRLLALNLVTGVIAMVVNLLATMPGNIIFFVLIFLIGHAINIAINLIGTYVHTNRLQYVEFFSKFYEGGGRSFTPFKINSKYFKFKEETINE